MTGTARWVCTAALALAACGGGTVEEELVPVLSTVESPTTYRLQAVRAVDDRVVWVSGAGGAVVRTTDGGATWLLRPVPDADSLEFRDIEAFDSLNAYLLAAGPGDRSRIYRTTDGGTTWTLQFRNPDPRAFYDCFAFWSPEAGLAMSDAVDSAFVFQRTSDGATWQRIAPDPDTPALPGEGAFAASGTCVVRQHARTAWLVTGASGQAARVLRSDDRGDTWRAVHAPVVHDTPVSGLTSIAFVDSLRGVVVGGDLGRTTDTLDAVAVTRDAGATWAAGGKLPFTGAAYVVAAVPGLGETVLAAGPRGAAWSRDLGATWMPLDSLNWWAADFSSRSAGWLVGPEGRIGKVQFRPAPAPEGGR